MHRFQDFEDWAKDHLGQGYSLEREDHTYIDPVTRWAAVAYRAGHSAGAQSGMADAARICEARAAAYGDLECQPAIEGAHCADAIRAATI
jgi:hypothetical protein